MDTELNCISHVRTSIEVADGLLGKNAVWVHYLLVIISQERSR